MTVFSMFFGLSAIAVWTLLAFLIVTRSRREQSPSERHGNYLVYTCLAVFALVLGFVAFSFK
jgi:ABC-type Fe3+ transport system permease subunit